MCSSDLFPSHDTGGYEDVHTVHEVQGETFEDVSLVRLTPTPVGIISKQSPHLLGVVLKLARQF